MESTGGQSDLTGLCYHSLQNLRVDMALVTGRVSAQEVEILSALDVPDVDALSSVNGDRQAGVVVAHDISIQVNKALVSLMSEGSHGGRSERLYFPSHACGQHI